jgi:AcrR family transcriptional regulator
VGNKAELIRQRIIEKADELFYQRGFEKTSFSDIASALNISRGNFYYHYKSKNDILDAVIHSRLQSIQQLLDDCERSNSGARATIRCCITLMTHHHGNANRLGCPAGTLCLELNKLEHAMRDNAKQVFMLFREWLTAQFEKLGKNNADQLAMHLLTRTQGLSIMMSTFNEADYKRAEIESLYNWLDSL